MRGAARSAPEGQAGAIARQSRYSAKLTSRLALGGIVGPIILVASFTIVGWLRPGYSAIGQVVSDLGLGPYAWAVNGAGLLNSVLLTVFVAAFFRRARTTLSLPRTWLCTVLLELPAVGYAVASVFTEAPPTSEVHTVLGAGLALALPAAAFYVTGKALQGNEHWRGWAPFSFVSALATAALVALTLLSFGLPSTDPDVEGLMERLLIVQTLAWYGVAGLRIARRPE
jgi:hypothetical membrane protein